MVNISLTAEQAAVIREVLIGYHNTLLLELSKAKHREFRDMLRSREILVTQILESVSAEPAHAN